MSLPQLQDLVRVFTPTIGAAPLAFGAAVPGYLPPEAMIDGGVYRYVLHDFDASSQPIGVELGLGTWNAGTQRLVRTLTRSSTGSLLILSGRGAVALTVSGADLTGLQDAFTAAAIKGLNLSDLTDKPAARAALGLGSAATQDAESLPVSTATATALAQGLAALRRSRTGLTRGSTVAGTVIDLGWTVSDREHVSLVVGGYEQDLGPDFTLDLTGATAKAVFPTALEAGVAFSAKKYLIVGNT